MIARNEREIGRLAERVGGGHYLRYKLLATNGCCSIIVIAPMGSMPVAKESTKFGVARRCENAVSLASWHGNATSHGEPSNTRVYGAPKLVKDYQYKISKLLTTIIVPTIYSDVREANPRTRCKSARCQESQR
jgi:hypothetical protein